MFSRLLSIVIVIGLLINVATCYKSTSGIRFRSMKLQSDQSSISNESKDCGPCPLAPKCKGDFREKGCDGTGKVQGGIATVPLFQWWPIKVYRPCPSYLQAGYVYRREGQTMDQVLFSEPSTKMKEKMEALRAAQMLEDEASKQAEIIKATTTSSTSSTSGDVDDAALKLLNDKFNKKDE